MRLTFSLCALLALGSCKGKDDPKPIEVARPAPVADAGPVDAGRHQPIETTRDKMLQDEADAKATAAKPKDAKKGDQQDSDWVPAEFKTGMLRWKDTGVYVDGKPIGFLNWGSFRSPSSRRG